MSITATLSHFVLVIAKVGRCFCFSQMLSILCCQGSFPFLEMRSGVGLDLAFQTKLGAAKTIQCCRAPPPFTFHVSMHRSFPFPFVGHVYIGQHRAKAFSADQAFHLPLLLIPPFAYLHSPSLPVQARRNGLHPSRGQQSSTESCPRSGSWVRSLLPISLALTTSSRKAVVHHPPDRKCRNRRIRRIEHRLCMNRSKLFLPRTE
jgi:hypothetical protein